MSDRAKSRPACLIISGACGGAGFAAALLLISAAVSIAPREAGATPAYASATGLACGQCHTNPSGGGALTDFGKSFQANGHKLPAKK